MSRDQGQKQTCCCCFGVHTGTFIIALLNVIFGSLNFIAICYQLIFVRGNVASDYGALPITAIAVITSAVLLYGNRQMKYQWYNPYIIFMGFYLVIYVIVCILLLIAVVYNIISKDGFNAIDYVDLNGVEVNNRKTYLTIYLIVCFFVVLINTLIFYYFWNVVRRGKQYLKDLRLDFQLDSNVNTISYPKHVV